MTDLVQRLRSYPQITKAIREEAADCIEELQQLLAKVLKEEEEAVDRIEELEAQLHKLRGEYNRDKQHIGRRSAGKS